MLSGVADDWPDGVWWGGLGTVYRIGTDRGAATEDGRNEDREASKMSVGGNHAVQMNENAPARPVIDKDPPVQDPGAGYQPSLC